MVKDIFEDGYEASKFIISTTVSKRKDGTYLCEGRVVQGRAKELIEGETDWQNMVVTTHLEGEDSNVIENMVLETLFQYMVSKKYYLFDDKEDTKEI